MTRALGGSSPRERGTRCRLGPAEMTVGSSPRERGTPRSERERLPPHRFIPARAGNALFRVFRHFSTPVHPRASGERTYSAPSLSAFVGSSPRERGTHADEVPGRQCRRFIPARAGNAAMARFRGLMAAVHPRASGERCSLVEACPSTIGSSPRERGTPPASESEGAYIRFIPARAGNASPSPASSSASAVHPRASGERSFRAWPSSSRFGSSPRERGTLHHDLGGIAHARFIPARAGNAWRSCFRRMRSAVHPRASGERW